MQPDNRNQRRHPGFRCPLPPEFDYANFEFSAVTVFLDPDCSLWTPLKLGYGVHFFEGGTRFPVVVCSAILFQGFFRQHDVIDPDSTFAVDDHVQGHLVRLLTFLEKERSLNDLPIGLLFHNMVHPS
jgi:hypothetical protein